MSRSPVRRPAPRRAAVQGPALVDPRRLASLMPPHQVDGSGWVGAALFTIGIGAAIGLCWMQPHPNEWMLDKLLRGGLALVAGCVAFTGLMMGVLGTRNRWSDDTLERMAYQSRDAHAHWDQVVATEDARHRLGQASVEVAVVKRQIAGWEARRASLTTHFGIDPLLLIAADEDPRLVDWNDEQMTLRACDARQAVLRGEPVPVIQTSPQRSAHEPTVPAAPVHREPIPVVDWRRTGPDERQTVYAARTPRMVVPDVPVAGRALAPPPVPASTAPTPPAAQDPRAARPPAASAPTDATLPPPAPED
jgi:hypothetical protein